jgi:hypothetical protein
MLWVMINPGTGDTEKRRRPTLERCINFTRSWVSDPAGIMLANLFAVRTKKANGLRSIQDRDRVGQHNYDTLDLLSKIVKPKCTIFAWGNWGARYPLPVAVIRLFREPQCLGLAAKDQPCHPLPVPGKTTPVPYLL